MPVSEEDVGRLFKAASTLGYRYAIPLLGDESIVPMAGPGGTEDPRVSDSEHIIHELAHCVLWGADFEGDPERLLERLAAVAPDGEKAQVGEVEAFSVTMEVLRHYNIPIDESDFLCQLNVQLTGYDPPPGTSVKQMVRTFHATERGKAAVDRIVAMLKESA